MIKILKESDWSENGLPTYLCTLNFYPQDITDIYKIIFFEFTEYGLGQQLGAVIEINNIMYFLFSAYDETGTFKKITNDADSDNPNRESLKVTIKIQGTELDIQGAFDNLDKELELTKKDIYYLNEKISN